MALTKLSICCILAPWILTSFIAMGCIDSEAGPVVATNNGKVRGECLAAHSRRVSAFLGIPFAQPPTGDNRFRKPLAVKNWNRIHDATSKPPICTQMSSDKIPWVSSGNRSEDCLFLNIWSPSICGGGSLKGQSRKLPVMVWIHGGGYYSGWSGEEFYDGATLAAMGDVVVASFNYRVGYLGFFFSGTEDAPGNMGLYDQNLALKWIKDNIEYFGGDANSITLFGESAGAVSVGLHVVSPLSKGLFHKAILQSGSPFHPQLSSPSAVAKFKSNMFASLVGCSDDTTNLDTQPEQVVQCMKAKDPAIATAVEGKILEKLPMFFIPVYGDDFMPRTPIAAITSGDFNKVPVLSGNNKDEGSIFMPLLLPEYFNATHSATLNPTLGKMFIGGLFQNVTQPPPNVVVDFYMDGVSETDSEAIVRQVHHSFGDYIFVCPNVFFAEYMPESYFYFFTHRQNQSTWGEWTGVPHFEEVPFVFGIPLKFTQTYTEEEKEFSKNLMHEWTLFAKTGRPYDSADSVPWPRYSSSSHLYRELNPTSSSTGTGPRLEACNFWRSYFEGKS